MVDSGGGGGVAVGGYTCRYLVCVTDLTLIERAVRDYISL